MSGAEFFVQDTLWNSGQIQVQLPLAEALTLSSLRCGSLVLFLVGNGSKVLSWKHGGMSSTSISECQISWALGPKHLSWPIAGGQWFFLKVSDPASLQTADPSLCSFQFCVLAASVLLRGSGAASCMFTDLHCFVENVKKNFFLKGRKREKKTVEANGAALQEPVRWDSWHSKSVLILEWSLLVHISGQRRVNSFYIQQLVAFPVVKLVFLLLVVLVSVALRTWTVGAPVTWTVSDFCRGRSVTWWV